MRRKLLVTKAQSDLMECMAYMTYVGAKDGTFAFLVPGKIYVACSNVQIFNPHNAIITQILVACAWCIKVQDDAHPEEQYSLFY